MNDTLDLFPEHPTPKPGSMLELVAMPGVKLTPMQKSFRQLSANIVATEARLLQGSTLLEMFRPMFANKLQPLRDEADKLNRKMVLFLDEKLSHKGWTANQRKAMREIACQLARTLFGGEHDADMKAVFDRHNDISAAQLLDIERAELKADMEDVFGIDLGPDDGIERSTEEILLEAKRLAEERGQAEEDSIKTRRTAKKSTRQSAAEQQAIDAGKLLKEIYRKLTSAIHPDREPDADERARKTALMAEVNQAHDEGNLMKLLRLQFQAVKFDPRAAETLADEKLKLINQTLRRQWDDLRTECFHLENLIREEFDLDHYGAPTVPILERALKFSLADERYHLKIMRADLAEISASDSALKAWLKSQYEMMHEREIMQEAIAAIIMPPTKRKRRAK